MAFEEEKEITKKAINNSIHILNNQLKAAADFGIVVNVSVKDSSKHTNQILSVNFDDVKEIIE